MDHVIAVPAEWSALSEVERKAFTSTVRCGTCLAAAYRPCTPRGPFDPLSSYDRRYSWEPFHVLRWVDAERVYKDERRAVIEHIRLEERRLAFDISRTCPWCGTMFDTVILMEKHEVGCE